MNFVRSGLLALCLWLAAAGLAAMAEPPHHVMHLRLDPAGGAIAVRDRIAVSGRKAFALRLAEWMRIGEVRIDGRVQAARPSRGAVTLALPGDGRHEIDIVAEGVVPGQGAGTTPQGAAAGPLAGPDGVYLPGWADWFPDTGDADFSYELTVETPPGVTAVATGRLVSETRNDARNGASFSTTRAQEPPSVFAGPYTVSEKTIANIRIRTYFHQSVAALAESYIEAAGRYLELFVARIGP